MTLYNFTNLENFLKSIGVQISDNNGGYKLIKGVNFEKAYKKGDIDFRGDGIYIVKDDKEYRGYMFIKEPYIEQYDSYPKFHLIKCSTIDEFISNGLFKTRYEWSNSDKNDLIDKTTRKIYKDQVLDFCGNCRGEIDDTIDDTIDFNELIKSDSEDIVKDILVDRNGYTNKWVIISKKYRKEQHWTCKNENCGIILDQFNEKWHLHVHHKDNNKLNNSPENLKCLCILCHAFQDEIHITNFKNSTQLKSFIELKKIELKDNPFINRVSELGL